MNVEISEAAKRDIRRLDKPVARRVIMRLSWFADNIDDLIPMPMKGKWSGFFKLRIGDYRVLYEIIENENLIFVIQVGHRREIYR